MATRERRAEVMRIGGSFRIGDRLSLVALDEFLFTEMFMEMTDGTVEAV